MFQLTIHCGATSLFVMPCTSYATEQRVYSQRAVLPSFAYNMNGLRISSLSSYHFICIGMVFTCS